VKSLHEMADTFKRRSATVMEDSRRTLLDISEAANNMTRKIAPQAVAAPAPSPAPRRSEQKRQ
jgi:phospholipid/cholesterol/gamma-HCH transport system substrate-binding protein